MSPYIGGDSGQCDVKPSIHVTELNTNYPYKNRQPSGFCGLMNSDLFLKRTTDSLSNYVVSPCHRISQCIYMI